MARIRTIKPDFWEDEAIAALSLRARLLFIATWNFADDQGRLRWTPEYVSASAFMYDSLSAKTVGATMDELVDAGLVVPYTAGKTNQRLAYIPNFLRHQRINRPQESRLPSPPCSRNDSVNDSVNTHGTLSEPSLLEGKGREGKGSSSSARDEDRGESRTADEDDEEDDEAMVEARRRLDLQLSRGVVVVDKLRWLATVAANVRLEPKPEPRAKRPEPTCPTCNDVALAEPCPDCGRSAA